MSKCSSHAHSMDQMWVGAAYFSCHFHQDGPLTSELPDTTLTVLDSCMWLVGSGVNRQIM